MLVGAADDQLVAVRRRDRATGTDIQHHEREPARMCGAKQRAHVGLRIEAKQGVAGTERVVKRAAVCQPQVGGAATRRA